jgi:hypothetical protein
MTFGEFYVYAFHDLCWGPNFLHPPSSLPNDGLTRKARGTSGNAATNDGTADFGILLKQLFWANPSCNSTLIIALRLRTVLFIYL